MLCIDGELFSIDSRFEDRVRRTLVDLAEEQRDATLRGQDRQPTLVTEIVDGVAVVQVLDVMVRSESYFATSYPVLARDLRALENNPDVQAVVLRTDTPGGHAAGIGAVTSALDAMTKPVHMFVDGLCCSAGMVLACHCTSVTSAKDSTIGSIGTICALYDFSKYFEKEGIEAVNITTGPHKAAGRMGAPITEEQRAMLQEWINDSHQNFLGSLKTRGLSQEQIAAVNTGAIWLAPKAKQLGLIDAIGTLESVIAAASAAVQVVVTGDQSRKKGSAMSEAPKAATLPELKAACPGASSDFLLAQLEAGSTVAASQTAFILHLQQERDRVAAEAKAQLEAAAKAAAAPAAKAGKVDQITGGQVGSNSLAADAGGPQQIADPISEFEDLVVKAKVEFNGDSARAVRSVMRSNPELYQQYRAATARVSTEQADRLRRRRVGGQLAHVLKG